MSILNYSLNNLIILIAIFFCSIESSDKCFNKIFVSSLLVITGSSPKLNKYIRGTCKFSANLNNTFEEGKLYPVSVPEIV